MRRGDLVTVAAAGDFGKPRPAVVIQSDGLAETGTVLVCLLTNAVRDAPLYRLTVEPSSENGLAAVSQVMVDKIMAVWRRKCGAVIGRLTDVELSQLDSLLALIVGLAD